MWDLGFYGYTTTRTFFTEIYPDCSEREASIIGIDETSIESGKDITLFSASNVSLGQLDIANGGHLNVSAGGTITLSNGFHAQQGSKAKLSLNYNCSTNEAPVSAPTHKNNDTENISEKLNFYVTPNPASDLITIHSQSPIKKVFLYNINGQIVLQTEQLQIDISLLPKGIYLIRAVTKNDQMLQTKIIH